MRRENCWDNAFKEISKIHLTFGDVSGKFISSR